MKHNYDPSLYRSYLTENILTTYGSFDEVYDPKLVYFYSWCLWRSVNHHNANSTCVAMFYPSKTMTLT